MRSSSPSDLSRGRGKSRQAGATKAGTANGGTDLYPIFHFKGRAARCAGFAGMGTDGQGTRVPFGTATTDYGFMAGEYWAARQSLRGDFTHI